MISIDDFVMLGKTKPEDRADGRTFVCSAGYSATLRDLVRVYPLAMMNAPRRWDLHTVNLERNPEDPRAASFRIAARRDAEHHRWINREFQRNGHVPREHRDRLFHHSCWVDSIAEANTKRRSLALIRPLEMQVEWTRPDSRNSIDVNQLELLTVENHNQPLDRIPRMAFTDSDGDHLLQLRDWGVYELIRKQGAEFASQHLAEYLHLNQTSALLVGNLLRHQNVWLVISVLNIGYFEQLELSA